MRVFAFGGLAQASDWVGANCGQCARTRCEIRNELRKASLRGDLDLPSGIAVKMGIIGARLRARSVRGPWTWDCPERIEIVPPVPPDRPSGERVDLAEAA